MPGRGPPQVMDEAVLGVALHRLEANVVRSFTPFTYLVMPATLRMSDGIVRFVHSHRSWAPRACGGPNAWWRRPSVIGLQTRNQRLKRSLPATMRGSCLMWPSRFP